MKFIALIVQTANTLRNNQINTAYPIVEECMSSIKSIVHEELMIKCANISASLMLCQIKELDGYKGVGPCVGKGKGTNILSCQW